MNPLKIDKRIAEQTASLRKYAETLPDGMRRNIMNRCDALELIGRRAKDQLATAHHRAPVANYDARTEEDMAAQAEHKAAVFAALMQGRKVDLTMAAEFKLSQMHTAIAQIRRDINNKNLPLVLCDEWYRPQGGRPYKQYWIVNTEQNEHN